MRFLFDARVRREAERELRRDPLDAGLRISSVSAVWTLFGSSVSVGVGWATRSLSLVAFGALGLFDCLSDLVLIAHFRQRRRGHNADRSERRSLQIVGAGLLLVGLRTGWASWSALGARAAPDPSAVAVAVSAISFAMLSAIGMAKVRIAHMIGSVGLRADAQLTLVGSVLGAVALCGVALNAQWGLWWADSVAAVGIALGAFWLSLQTFRSL